MQNNATNAKRMQQHALENTLSCPPRWWLGARVGVGMLRCGGDSKILQDLPRLRDIDFPRFTKIPRYFSKMHNKHQRFLRFQDLDVPRFTTVIQNFEDSKILIFQDVP